jgi:hypothetical protein
MIQHTGILKEKHSSTAIRVQTKLLRSFQLAQPGSAVVSQCLDCLSEVESASAAPLHARFQHRVPVPPMLSTAGIRQQEQ